MEKRLLEFDHLKKIAIASKQHIDSLVLELTNILKDIRDRISNDNILDNCNFKINQLNMSGTINTPGYFVDRWKLVDGEVTIEEDGIRLNGTIEQILENGIDGRVTASVFTDSGIMFSEYDNLSKTFQITGNGQLLKMAKLELGNKQTLARKEDNNWVLNDPPPNIQQELLKCQRYMICLRITTHTIGTGVVMNPTTCRIIVPLPTALRATPICNVSGDFEVYGVGSTNVVDVSNIELNTLYGSILCLTVTVDSILDRSLCANLRGKTGSVQTIILDANI